jgi:hypothetical protein
VTDIAHALCLNLHQPAGNLAALSQASASGDRGTGEGADIVACYLRIADHAEKYRDVARLHLAVSGALVDQWRDPALGRSWDGFGDLVARLRSLPDIEWIGSGLARPVFSRIPVQDWDRHLAAERALFTEVLGRAPRGFRAAGDRIPPGLVGALARAGYAYLLLPAAALVAATGEPVDPFRPYEVAEGADRIAVIPIDADLSAAQAHGLDVAWFADEARARTGGGEGLRLIATWSDGENGPWFRTDGDNFFERFFAPAMEFCETGEYPLRPVFLSEIVATARALPEARLAAGNDAAEPVPDRLVRVSGALRRVEAQGDPARREALDEARMALLAVEDGDLSWPEAGEAGLDRVETILGRLAAPAKPVLPALAPARPVVEPAKSVTEPAKSVTEPAKSVTEPAKSVTEPAKNATAPAKNAGKPAKNAGKPAKNAGKPAKNAGKPAKNTGKPAKPVVAASPTAGKAAKGKAKGKTATRRTRPAAGAAARTVPKKPGRG